MCKHMSRRFMAVFGVALLLTLVSATAWAAVPPGWTEIGVGPPGPTAAGNDSANAMLSNGGYLYVGVENAAGAQVWCYDGSSWLKIGDGASPDFDAANISIDSMAWYDGKLYVGTLNAGGAQVLYYDGSWNLVGSDPGDWLAANISIFSMCVFDGKLYVGTENANGAQVHSYNGAWAQETPGWSDTEVATTMVVYNSLLHVGTFREVSTSGGQVWTFDGVAAWTKIGDVGAPWAAADVGIAVGVAGGKLYAGTENVSGGKVWEHTGGATWVQIGVAPGDWAVTNTATDMICDFNGYLNVGTINASGSDVFSYDGSSWSSLVGIDPGFGDTNNKEVNSIISYNTALIVGTKNVVTGCQIWKYNPAIIPPEPVPFVCASSGATTTEIMWTASPSINTAGYNIYVSVDGGPWGAAINAGNHTGHEVATSPTQDYEFMVMAYNAFGIEGTDMICSTTAGSVTSVSTEIVGGTDVTSYIMISFPIVPGSLVMTQLASVLGSYDPSSWRVFRYEADHSIYEEATAASAFRPGMSCWLISKEPATLTISGYATGHLSEYYVMLVPGWNQIGNPFPGDAIWSNCDVIDGATTVNVLAGGNTYTSHNVWEYISTTNSYSTSSIIPALGGRWLLSNATHDVYLKIPDPAGKPSSGGSDVPVSAPAGEEPPPPPGGFGSAGSGGGGCFISTTGQ